MKKWYLSILLVFCTFIYLLAVPHESNIKMTPVGNHCFTDKNEAVVTWSKSFKEEFNYLWPWPTTWTATTGIAPVVQSSIYVEGLDEQPSIDATTGTYTIIFPKPGVYTVTVKIAYEADRTTFPTYANESFTKTFNISFYKVKKFEPLPNKKVICKGSELTKADFIIETEPSTGVDIFVWSKDSTDVLGARKAFLKLDGKTCENTEFMVLEISSETIFVDPAPRTRKIIGVGETVKIFVNPSDISVAWSLEIGNDVGSISQANGNSTVYTSSKTASKVKITVTYQGVEICPYIIETIQPSGILLEVKDGVVNSGFFQSNTVPKAWYLWFNANIYAEPKTVNFSNLEVFEKFDKTIVLITTGIFTRDYGQNSVHQTGAKVKLDKWTSKGTIASKTDFLQLQINSPVNSEGTGDWVDIDWQYSWSGTEESIELITQSSSIRMDSKTTFSGDIIKDLATGTGTGNRE